MKDDSCCTIEENARSGFQLIFDLEKQPETIDDLQSLVLQSHQIKKLERTVLAWVARYYLEYGLFPTEGTISKELNLDLKTIREIFNSSRNKGVLTINKENTITGAYGVSSLTTPHSFSIDGRKTYVWCAIDSLGIPLVMNKNAEIQSKCSYCKDTINISIPKGRLEKFDPKTMIFVGFSGEIQKKISEDFCPYINYFCSIEHLQEWKKTHPTVKGVNMALPAAGQFSKSIFLPFADAR